MCAAVKINRIGKFDLNPRGNLWLKDENRFGHKLLSKMGWSQGKGLGKNEDGIAENVKVRMKTSNTGVGWTEKMPVAMEAAEYDAILSSLNKKFKTPENEAKKENDFNSLEHRSQQFRNRLHYGKFVKGKDVCKYSEKDMNSIFIMKKNKTEPKLVSVKSSVTNIESSPTEDQTPKSMPTFKSQMSMKEYFESKMKRKSLEKLKSKVDSEEINVCEGVHAINENSSKKKKKALEKGEKLKCVKSDTYNSTLENEMMDESSDSKQRTADVICSMTEPVENLSDITKERSRKKRKKDEESITKQKKFKSDMQEVLNESQNEVNSDVVLLGEYASPEVQFLGKGGKKLKSAKHKSSKVKKLKSCLKNNVKYSLHEPKEVSFSEQTFYKIIDNEFDEEEDNKLISREVNVLCNPVEKEISNGPNYNLLQNDFNNTLANGVSGEQNSLSIGDKQLNDELQDNSEDDALEVPNCLDLPKCDKSNYDSWLENQRMAIKMKLYKSMIKKMRKHPILRTTNLLHIKGYGNWGF